jgi:esterase/lipase
MIKNISIPYKKNQKIIGDLHINKNSKKLFILCHGFGDSKDEPNVKRFAELLNYNHNVFRFTFTDKDKTFLPTQKENIISVVNFFSKKFNEIIVIGASLGGLSLLLSTIENNKIDRLIFINPFIYIFKKVAWKYGIIILSMFLMYPFVKEIRENLNFYFQNLRPNLIKIPTLIIVGSKDKKVSSNHGKDLFYQLSNTQKKLIVDNEIDHGLTQENYKKKVIEYINNWIKNND